MAGTLTPPMVYQNSGFVSTEDWQAYINDLVHVNLGFTTGPVMTVKGEIEFSTQVGITASVTQTQGQQPLTKTYNEISVCANTSDTVTMPSASAGKSVTIVNNGAQTLQVFPASGDNFQGVATDASISVKSGSRISCWGEDATIWQYFAGTFPADPDTSIQYNSGGQFAGSANLIFDGTDVTIATTGRINFRDTNAYIYSDANDRINIYGLSRVTIGSGTQINVNASNAYFSGQGDFSGWLTSASHFITDNNVLLQMADNNGTGSGAIVKLEMRDDVGTTMAQIGYWSGSDTIFDLWNYIGPISISSGTDSIRLDSSTDLTANTIGYDGSAGGLSFDASNNATLTDNLTMTGAKPIYFRDTAIGIYSQADTFMDLFADGAVRIGNSAAGAPTTYLKIEPDGTTSVVGANLVLPKTTNVGIKVDTASPTFGWKDLLGDIKTRPAAGGGAAAQPDFAVYRGSIYAYRFGTTAPNNHLHECFVEFHIPHDYVPGSDIYIHTHWSQIVVDTGGAASAPGVSEWFFDVTYAKGYGTAGGAGDPFIAPITTSVVCQGSTTQYAHMICEVQLSDPSPSASQLDSDNLEVDGLLLVRAYRTPSAGNDTLDQDAFLHYVDVHYQSTNMATKDKNTPFYT